MKVRTRYSLLVLAAAVAILGTSLVAHATSAGATIKIGPTATLANPPTSVIVTIDYSCQPTTFSFGQVTVDQLQPGTAASGVRNEVFGFGFFNATCDDKTHRASVVVTTFNGGASFIPGSAGASAFVGGGATFASTTAEISIR